MILVYRVTRSEGNRLAATRRVYDEARTSAGAGSANSICRRTRAGAPAAIDAAGMSVVTTLLAPMTQRSPIVAPLVTTTFAPHHTLSPMRVGPFEVNPCHVTGMLASSKRWLPSV